MGELVGIDELLVGRPLLLELFERARVDHGAPRLKLMDVDVHHAHVFPAAGGATRHNLTFIQPPMQPNLGLRMTAICGLECWPAGKGGPGSRENVVRPQKHHADSNRKC